MHRQLKFFKFWGVEGVGLDSCLKPLCYLLSSSTRKKFGRGEKTPTPTLSTLLRKRPGLLRADVVLTKDPEWPDEGQLGGKKTGRGLAVRRPVVLSKDKISP